MGNFIKKLIPLAFIFSTLVYASPVFAQPIDPPSPDEVKKDGFTLIPGECLGEHAAEIYDSNFPPPQNKKIGDPVCGFPELMQLVANIMTVLLVVSLSIATLLFAIAGFQYATAAGNPNQIEGAKKIFTNVAIGLVLVFGAYLIVQVIVSILGVEDEYNIFLDKLD